MKIRVNWSVVLLFTMVIFPAQALADLALYDDFEAEFIDVNKWTLVEVSGGTAGELVREIHGWPGHRRLHLVFRAYGNLNSNIGVVGGRNRLQFPSQNFAAINAIEARVAVKDFEATGCAENPDATQARARISGFFFTLPNPRLPGNPPTPVLADIRIERRSDSTDHPRVLQVLSVLFHCDDTNCVLGQIVESFPLGTIRQWASAELFIQWDQATQTWTARRDDLVVERVLPDAGPFAGAKRLDISPSVANCPSPPRGVSHMDVLFDNVRITAPPAPSP